MDKPESPICMTLTVAARRVYDFKVEGYSVAKTMTSGGKYFQSDTFSVGGYDWAMRFSYHAVFGSTSFYLVCLSKIKSEVGVVSMCTLLEKSGKPSATIEQRLSTKFSCCGQREVFAGFMSEEDYKDHLQDDCLTYGTLHHLCPEKSDDLEEQSTSCYSL